MEKNKVNGMKKRVKPKLMIELSYELSEEERNTYYILHITYYRTNKQGERMLPKTIDTK